MSHWRYNRLVQSLRLLAASFDDQMRVFPEWVVVPDELAETFGEAYEIYLQEDTALISPKAQRLIAGLHSILDMMSGDARARLWTVDALRNAGEWHQIRTLAGDALAELNEPRDPVTLEGMVYVQA